MGEQLARRADIYVALPIKDEIRSAELAVGPGRFVPYRHVRGDRAIHEPLEQPSDAINGVAGKPLGPKIEAALDAVHHGLGDGDLLDAIGARAFSIDNDPGLVVDQIVRIVGKERVHPWPGNPGRLRIGQGAFFRRLASAAAATVVSAATLLITAGGIESRNVFAN